MKKRVFIRKDEEGVSPVIATILMVAITVVLAAVLYIMVINLNPDIRPPPTGSVYVEVKGPTEAWATFAKISNDPNPIDLKIVLLNETHAGTYAFSSGESGTVLTVSEGDDMGTLTYRDYGGNKKVNQGDQIVMTSLGANGHYTLMVIWKNGDRIATADFLTTGV